MRIAASTEARARVLKRIVEVTSSLQVRRRTDIGGVWWMSLWHIHIASGYSMEYVRQVVRALYLDEFSLIRTQKGAAFFYRPNTKAESVLESLEKAIAKEHR